MKRDSTQQPVIADELTPATDAVFANEGQLQHAIVKWFSQSYPDLSGCFCAVHNEAGSRKGASINISKGVYPGASDLVFFYEGLFAWIELKHEGSRHDLQRVKNQLKFGMNVIKHDGFFLITYEIDMCKIFINSLLSRDFDTAVQFQDMSIADVSRRIAVAESKGVGSVVF